MECRCWAAYSGILRSIGDVPARPFAFEGCPNDCAFSSTPASERNTDSVIRIAVDGARRLNDDCDYRIVILDKDGRRIEEASVSEYVWERSQITERHQAS